MKKFFTIAALIIFVLGGIGYYAWRDDQLESDGFYSAESPLVAVSGVISHKVGKQLIDQGLTYRDLPTLDVPTRQVDTDRVYCHVYAPSAFKQGKFFCDGPERHTGLMEFSVPVLMKTIQSLQCSKPDGCFHKWTDTVKLTMLMNELQSFRCREQNDCSHKWTDAEKKAIKSLYSKRGVSFSGFSPRESWHAGITARIAWSCTMTEDDKEFMGDLMVPHGYPSSKEKYQIDKGRSCYQVFEDSVKELDSPPSQEWRVK